MSVTTHNKRLVSIIIFLILVNLAMLAYFVWFKKSDKPPQNRVGIMIETLRKDVGFTDEQVEGYKQFKDARRQLLMPLVDQMHEAKENLFRLVGEENVPDSVLQATADKIALKQKELDLLTYNHFKRIRGLCKDSAQMARYDSAIPTIFRIAVPAPFWKKDTTNTKK